MLGNTRKRILISGLENAGRTTLLQQLNNRVPTVGCKLDTGQYKRWTFRVWDLGARYRIRREYLVSTDALVYVVDSTDKERLGMAKRELFMLLEGEELKHSVLLVFANKQDLPGACTATEVANDLDLSSIQNRPWTIMKSSVTTGMGLAEGMDWLCVQLNGEKPTEQERATTEVS
jgi:ADP-ribosylation factor-like protein 1